MFKINEAPKMVLDALSAQSISNKVWTGFSLFCCAPSCGKSLAWRPQSNSQDVKNSLESISQKLNSLIYKPDIKNSIFDYSDFVKSQTDSTLEIINQALNIKDLSRSYYELFETCMLKIHLKHESYQRANEPLNTPILPAVQFML